MASVLSRGRFAVDDILPSAATDPAIRALASKVKIEVDESQAGKFLPATVCVRTTEGKDLSATVTELAGTPAKPFSDADMRAKALACLASGVRPLSRDAAERFAARIAAVETASDMREWFAVS